MNELQLNALFGLDPSNADSRKLTEPDDSHAVKTEAKYQSGVLELRLPNA